MHRNRTLIIAVGLAALSGAGEAQTAGSTLLGVTVTELRDAAQGWSVRRTIFDRDVFNDADDKVRTIDDVIIGPDLEVTHAFVGAAGFLGLTRHDVAIPVIRPELVDDRLVVPGATREALQEAPPFRYGD